MSLAVKEVQKKTTMRYCFPLTGVSRIKKQKTATVHEDGGKLGSMLSAIAAMEN